MSAQAPVPSYDPAQRAIDEQRTWAMVGHLAAFAAFALPFGGLIAAIVLYNVRSGDVPWVRSSLRNALNAQITLAAVVILMFVTLIGGSISAAVFTAGPPHGARHGDDAWSPAAIVMLCVWSFTTALLLSSFVTAIFGARAGRTSATSTDTSMPFRS